MRTDQSIYIVSYDPRWPEQFREQAWPLNELLAPWLARPVEHIGSTSVPGLAAKPVVDILAPVRSLGEVRAAVPLLEANGWLCWPDDPARHYRLWCLRPDPAERTHHLHVIDAEDIHAIALLAFRDALRSDNGLREEYAKLKRTLAEEHADNRNAYLNSKSDFVEDTLRRVGVRPSARDPLPE